MLLLVLAITVTGTAGLYSLRGESRCQSAWTLREGGGDHIVERRSLLPPGVRCLHVDASGATLDEQRLPLVEGGALLVLALALLALIMRTASRATLPLRAAATAAAALLMWGLVNYFVGGFPGNWTASLMTLSPIAAFVTDRRLVRAGAGTRAWTDGAFGLLVAPVAMLLGLFTWIVIGPLGHAATVVLIAGGAAISTRGRRTASAPAAVA